jgi:hypothetical protein
MEPLEVSYGRTDTSSPICAYFKYLSEDHIKRSNRKELYFSMHATCPAHLILLDLMTLKILAAEYK